MATPHTTVVGPNWGRIIAGGIIGAVVLVALTFFAVKYFTSNPVTLPVPEVAASVTLDPAIESYKQELEEMRAERAAEKAQRAEEERVRNENERLAEVQRIADKMEELLREEIAETKRLAAEQAEAIRQEMQAAREEMAAAIASMAKVETPVQSTVPAGSGTIPDLSPEKAAAMLNLGARGSGYKPGPDDGSGPEVYSLARMQGTGGETIYLPNEKEGRGISDVPNAQIPPPQMKCAMPEGVTGLRWVQTSAPDVNKPGHFIYGLAPY